MVGVDISKEAIKRIYDKYKIRGFVVDLDNEKTRFRNGTFDFAIAIQLIEHLFFPLNFLKEAYRVLKPHGKLILTTINSAFWECRILYLIGKPPSELQGEGHIRFYSEKMIRGLLTKAGFKINEVLGVCPIPIIPFKLRVQRISALRPSFFSEYFIIKAKK